MLLFFCRCVWAIVCVVFNLLLYIRFFVKLFILCYTACETTCNFPLPHSLTGVWITLVPSTLVGTRTKRTLFECLAMSGRNFFFFLVSNSWTKTYYLSVVPRVSLSSLLLKRLRGFCLLSGGDSLRCFTSPVQTEPCECTMNE